MKTIFVTGPAPQPPFNPFTDTVVGPGGALLGKVIRICGIEVVAEPQGQTQ